MKPALLLSFLLIISSAIRAEYIFNADGSIIEARIIRQTATSVTIRLKNGRARTIKGSDILRIREKLLVKKNIRMFDLENGKVFEANLVDESPSSYTFRNNLAKPDEFNIKKDNLLFLDAPLALTPTVIPGSRSAKAGWDSQPSISRYFLYLNEGIGKLSKIYDGEKTETEIDGLKGNTGYSLILLAQDSDGRGLGPSKEVGFVTRNNPPSSPQKLSATELLGDSPSLVLSWDPSQDEDGKILKYKVYVKKGESFIAAGTSEKCEWMVDDYDRSVISTFAVSAVDDKNAESPPSAPVQSRIPSTYSLRFDPAYYYPLKSFLNSFTYGYGGIASVEKRNIVIDNLGFGLGTGFISFKGKGQNQGDLFPLLISTRYLYSFSESFAVSGGVSVGPAYYGGKVSGASFSRFAALGQLSAEVRARPRKNFELELSGLAGSLYASGSVRFFAGGSLAAIAVVEF